ncbi:MAG: twin-arginine translocase subunit TatC, partial [Bacteroidales bacterium]
MSIIPQLIEAFQSKSEDSSFIAHLKELRRIIIYSLIIFSIFVVVTFVYKDFFFDTVILSLSKPNFISYKALCRLGLWFDIEGLCVKAIPMKIINTDLGGQLRYHLVLSLAD